MKKIRLGLIGCGGMMKSHAQGVQKVEGVEITAVCDVKMERAQEVASVLNNPYVTSDYRTMVEYVDAVLVVLPHDLHYECGMFFAKQKKHILMEKPLCNTEEECLSLIETCEEERVVLMCAYPVRFWPGVVKLKELVDSGNYGKVIQMSIWTEQLTKSDPCESWLSTARIGGGQFFSHGCHYIDMMLWFLGNPVKGTHLGTRVGTPWLLKEGTSAATILFENGAIGYHGATWGARGSRLGWDVQIQTEKGMLEFDRYLGQIKLYDGVVAHKPGEPERLSYKVLWETDDAFQKQTQYEIRHFVNCIRTGEKPMVDGRVALQSLRVIWAMYDAEKHNVVADLRGMGIENIK